jgi:hypothetical protein
VPVKRADQCPHEARSEALLRAVSRYPAIVLVKELALSLVPAYRCTALDDACKGMRYEPERGLFPRGYAGATGTLTEVALVLVIAEPGEPSANAKPQPEATANELPAVLAERVGEAFRSNKSAFHRNVRFLLDCCFPGLMFEDQMRQAWITEGVMCSAAKTTGPVPSGVERECATRYLTAQLALLPAAFVIALGDKA